VPRTDTYIEKELVPSTSRSTACATRRRARRCSNATTSSSSPRCRASTVSARSRPYTAMTFALKKGRTGSTSGSLIADPRRPAIQAHPGRFHPRHLFACAADVIDNLSGALRGPRLARGNLFRRRGREHRRVRSAHRPQGRDDLEFIKIYANSHYVTPAADAGAGRSNRSRAKLKLRLDELNNQGRLLEAQRLEQRTTFDLEMMESHRQLRRPSRNYSRLSHRPAAPGEPPPDAVRVRGPTNALGVRGIEKPRHRGRRSAACSAADFRRKATLAEYGFSAALLHGQPAAAVRGMGHDAPAIGSRVVGRRRADGKLNESGGRVSSRQVIRPHRADRSARQHPPGAPPRSTISSARSAPPRAGPAIAR